MLKKQLIFTSPTFTTINTIMTKSYFSKFLEFNKVLNSSSETENFGREIARLGSFPGDVICLFGDLGTGKTQFSRGFIQEITKENELVVPSPTFMIQNKYKIKEKPYSVNHFDFYRLTHNKPKDFIEECEILELRECFRNDINIIEWPNILFEHKYKHLPKYPLQLHFISTNEKSNDMVDNGHYESIYDTEHQYIHNVVIKIPVNSNSNDDDNTWTERIKTLMI
eukprot:TRINITY_DN593_c0_g1_i1.p1 TRINITY_DN593_c0_g1~~TRINITY_DN593_c0_g1_i1.p1  ORF type:complete len:224 (-),score=12.69 TRINITY_DN593_c0_g1_i1:74-745(-)